MQKILLTIAKRFWPELADMPFERQVVGVGEVFAFLYSTPVALVGLVWLARITDLILIRENLVELLLIFGLYRIFLHLRFFLIIEWRTNRYGSMDGSMAGIVLWSALFLFGPSALWVSVVWFIVQGVINIRKPASKAETWNLLRNLFLSLAGDTFIPLVAISAYQSWGGEFGFTLITIPVILKSLGAILLYSVLYIFLWAGYFGYNIWVRRTLAPGNPIFPLVNFFLLSSGIPQLVLPFSILATGMYMHNGLAVYLFFMAGMLSVAYLTRRLSLTGESSRQQYRALEKLEQLGRSIINSPPGLESLSKNLEQHIPHMFPSGRILLWRFPDQILFKSRPEWTPDLDPVWPWLLGEKEGKAFLASDKLPWHESFVSHNPTVVAPILDVETGQAFAGVYVALQTLTQPWNRRSINHLLPIVQSLADQIASAIHQSEISTQTLELQRVTQELNIARSIQSSFLPYTFPSIPGWQLAVSLSPAGEMAGDFFDIIPLADGRVGLVIADVLDKGLGPALYMALSRTLIRTYATEFDMDPDTVFFATNERILRDTRANLFVTTFYGILDPSTGKLTYSNAGHNPPYLLSANQKNGENIQGLRRTGIPIGIDEDATWEQATVELGPGDCLILYTDGIPEAENAQGEFFEENSLVETAKNNLGNSAEDMQSSILNSVRQFVGDTPPSDDITLMVLVRDKES